MARANDYDQAMRGSSQAPVKPQKKQKLVQGGRGSSRNAIRDSQQRNDIKQTISVSSDSLSKYNESLELITQKTEAWQGAAHSAVNNKLDQSGTSSMVIGASKHSPDKLGR